MDDVRRYRVLAAVCLAGLILPLEYTGPAMALPAIQAELGGSPLALSWVINAFALSFGSAVMAGGALADQYGRRRMFITGIAGFTVFSVIVSLSGNVVFLDLVRGLQGVTAALTMGGGAAALAQEFEGQARTRAFGLLGTAFGVGLASGPVISGALVEWFGWRSVFFLGAVFGALALYLGLRHMKETRDPDAGKLDMSGVITFTAFLLLLTFGIMQIGQGGENHIIVTGLLTGAAMMLVLFVFLELRHDRPMLDLSLFRYWKFIGVQFLPIATATCFIVLLILLPIRLIGIEGYSEFSAGLAMIALSAPMIAVPFAAALMTRWLPSADLSCLGLLLAGIGLGWLATMPVGTSPHNMALPLLLIGTGTGLPWGLMDDLSISVVPVERAGMATGIFTTMRACGEAICVAGALAILGSLLYRGLEQQGGLDAGQAGIAAASLTTGNLDGAMSVLGHMPQGNIGAIYSDAFSMLVYILMVITLAAALICFLALKSSRAPMVPMKPVESEFMTEAGHVLEIGDGKYGKKEPDWTML